MGGGFGADGDAPFVSKRRFPDPVKTTRQEVAKRVGMGTGHCGVGSVELREVNENYIYTTPSCARLCK